MMTMDEKCSRCGKKIRSTKAATITQWLKTTEDCTCDSQNRLTSAPSSPDSDSDKEIVRCSVCGKDRSPTREGSLTQWIFKDNRCKCDWTQLQDLYETISPHNSGTFRVELPDAEIEALLQSDQIDFHGLEKDSFPFERYRIVREMGRGSAGTVYKCWDTSLEKCVAIKTIRGRTLTAENTVRLQHEARAASKLSHPSIVQILDFGASSNGSPYMVMEYADGMTLDQLLKEKGAMDQEAALQLFSQILDGIAHAHRQGIFHRDIKPSNVVVVERPGITPLRARLIDFSIAAFTKSVTVSTSLSGESTITGTPSYMSPEQAEGQDFDQRCDIYSLGCLFYETLSGFNPFHSETIIETLSRHANLMPPRLSDTSFDRQFDSELEAVVAKMLEKSPQMRYQSAEEAKVQIDSIRERLHEAASARQRQTIDNVLIWKNKKSPGRPDFLLTTILISTALLIVSITILVLNRTSDNVSGKEAVQGAPEQVRLTEDIRDRSYLEDIVLPNSSKNDAYLQSLSSTQDVRVINLRMSEVTDEGIKSLESLPTQLLDLSYTGITDKALESVSRMPQLHGLYVGGTGVSAQGLRYLTHSPNLEFLDVSAIPEDVEKMSVIASIPHLNRLYLLSVSSLSSQCLKQLQSAPQLQCIALRRSPLKRAQIEELSKLKQVESLLLTYCGLTDSTITPIAKMQKLKMLDIAGNSISDQGLKEVAKLKDLQELYIAYCPVTAKGIAWFKHQRPNCHIRNEIGPTVIGSGQLER